MVEEIANHAPSALLGSLGGFVVGFTALLVYVSFACSGPWVVTLFLVGGTLLAAVAGSIWYRCEEVKIENP